MLFVLQTADGIIKKLTFRCRQIPVSHIISLPFSYPSVHTTIPIRHSPFVTVCQQGLLRLLAGSSSSTFLSRNPCHRFLRFLLVSSLRFADSSSLLQARLSTCQQVTADCWTLGPAVKAVLEMQTHAKEESSSLGRRNRQRPIHVCTNGTKQDSDQVSM